MAGSWRRRGGPAAQLLGAVVAYLRLLDAEWESLDDARRRSAVRLALEAAGAAPRQSAGGDDALPASEPAHERVPQIAQEQPGPNA